MSKLYTIGLPGGMNGPFYSVIRSDGNVVSMQITTEEYAEMIRAAAEIKAGNFDTISTAGKRLTKILKRDKVKGFEGMEDYLIRAFAEAVFSE